MTFLLQHWLSNADLCEPWARSPRPAYWAVARFSLIKLQTCHPDQHSEKASEKNSLTPNVRGTAQNSTCTNEGNNKLHNSHSLGEIIPGVASHLSLYFSIKSLISGASSQNTVSSSGDLPPTNSQLMLVLSQPVAQAVGESLFVLLPTEGMKHKVTLPISL